MGDMTDERIKSSWRSVKQLITNKALKYSVKKATSHLMLPPKTKHENNLISFSTVSNRSYESNNFEIIRQLIKRSCNDNDVVSLKSLIVLHRLIMSPETRNMRCLGAYFLNFSYDNNFNKVGRPAIIRKYGHYIDVMARNYTGSGLDLDTIRNRTMKYAFRRMPIADIYKVTISLEKAILIILNFDLPTIYCSNVLIYEVLELVGMNLISFINCYTEAIADLTARANEGEGDRKYIQIIDAYFILVQKVRVLKEYLKQHIFNIDAAYYMRELNKHQLQLIENIKFRQGEKRVPTSVPSLSSGTSEVPVDILIHIETTAPAKNFLQWTTFNSESAGAEPIQQNPTPIQQTPQLTLSSNQQGPQQSKSGMKNIVQSIFPCDFTQEAFKIDDQDAVQLMVFSNSAQELQLYGREGQNPLQSTLIGDDPREFLPSIPDSLFQDTVQSTPTSINPSEVKAPVCVPFNNNPFVSHLNPTPAFPAEHSQFRPNTCSPLSLVKQTNPFMFWAILFLSL